MSSAQHVDTTEEPQPGTTHAGETPGLAASILQRTQWMQQVLSPWTQRWLARGDSEAASNQSGMRRPFTSLSGADTERTLARVHVQYESHSNLETPTTGGSLPLAGTVERSIPTAESTTPVAPTASRRAHGPYSRAFTSMDDFIRAIEAAKERDYAPPPPAEVQSQPAPQRTAGPYSRAFHSMEDFVQAVNAARERDYAPPPPEQLPQPAPKPEAGPYSRAFASFEDFVKAVEETRSQWGPSATEAAAAETAPQLQTPPSVPPARVRPISRIEELPSRTETRFVNSPIEFPAPLPEVSQPTPHAKPATTTPQAVAPAQPKATPTTVPQPAAAAPQVQRSPLDSATDLNVPEEDDEPVVQRSVTPTLQRLETPTRSEPAAPATSNLAAPVATPAPDQVAPRVNTATTPLASQPLDMPLVQRHAASDVSAEEVEEISADTAAPIETEQSTVQRQVAEIPQQPQVSFTTPPASAEAPAHTPKPTVQRRAADTQSQSTPHSTATPSRQAESPARAETPIVQRQPTATSSQPAESATQAEEPVVQRQAAEVPSRPTASSTTPPASNVESAAQVEEPTVQRQVNSPVQPESAATSFAPPDMPLVQRHAVTEVIEQEEPEDQSASTVQRQIAELESATPEPPIVPHPAASSPEKPTSQTTLPAASTPAQPVVVQRQAMPAPSTPTTSPRQSAATVPVPADQTTTPSVDLTPSRSDQMPLVQRQPLTPEPLLPEAVQSGEAPAAVPTDVPTTSRPPVVVPLHAEKTAPATSVDMPFVQRQPSEVTSSTPPQVQRHAAEMPVAADEVVDEETVQRHFDSRTPAVEPASASATPDQPVVQRQPVETKTAVPSAPTPAASQMSQTVQSSEKKIVAPLTETPAPAARIEMPLVQRQAAEPEFAAAEAEAEETALEESTAVDQVQRQVTTEPAPQAAVTPAVKPATPSVKRVQRRAAKPIDTTESAAPAANENPIAPAAAVEAYAPQDMPFVQRQSLEPTPDTATSQPTLVQRSAAPDEAESTAAQMTSELSERILSRVAPPERRAAVKPVDLPLHHVPVASESSSSALVSRQSATSESGASSLAASASITASAAPAIQRLPEPVIQRTALESETSSAEPGFIQRVETVPATVAEQAAEDAKPVDLDQLARQVYPIIKRMIAVERERRAFR